jgi:hypothetical protein
MRLFLPMEETANRKTGPPIAALFPEPDNRVTSMESFLSVGIDKLHTGVGQEPLQFIQGGKTGCKFGKNHFAHDQFAFCQIIIQCKD